MQKLVLAFAVMFGIVVVAQAQDAAKVDGAALYAKDCAMCHGKDGKSKMKGVQDLSDAKINAAVTDEAFTKALKEGVKAEEGVHGAMKAFDTLTADEVKAIIAYTRTLAAAPAAAAPAAAK